MALFMSLLFIISQGTVAECKHLQSLEASVCSIFGLLEMVLYTEVDNTLQCTLQVHVRTYVH